jgi:hypothetical protein
MPEVKVNSKGTNIAIKYHVLSDDEMRKLGFWDGYDHEFDHWCRSVSVKKAESDYDSYDLKRIKKNPNYKPRYDDIVFDISIPKNGVDDLDINTIDDDFCQPYDWQSYIEKGCATKCAYGCRDFVEKQMELLQAAGLLEGHIKGEYI